ncbi:MAG: hypothetical protein WBD51_11930 [Burkholderiaceae bacterium]
MNQARLSSRRLREGSPVSYWLVPASPDRELLKKSIDLMATQFNAPLFDPHITLFSTVLANKEDPAVVLSSVASRFNPMLLTCGPTGHSGMLFKTLFVEFSFQEVTPIANAIRDRCQRPSSYRLEPHLSLLYRNLPPDSRKALAEKIDYSGKQIPFSSIVAVMPGEGHIDFQQVDSWTVVASAPLSEVINLPAGDNQTPESASAHKPAGQPT